MAASHMPSSSRFFVWVPRQLAEAVDERAALAGVTRSDVVRVALAREVERKIDKRARAEVELWLAGELHDNEEEHV